MSADVRALLKAKTQERAKRISHPLAAYNASGQLRCTLCATVVKDNEIAWSGHLGSKAHRTNVGRQKEVLRKEEERARLEKGKRKAVVEGDEGSDGMEEDEEDSLRVASASKRQKTEEEQRPPANFFSDPTRALPSTDVNSGSDEDEGETTTPKPVAPKEPSKPGPMSQVDLEWAQFEREVLAPNARATAAANADDPPLSKKDIYDRATVVMEEEIRYDGDGFPGDAPPTTQTGAGGIVGEYVGGPPPPAEETPEEAAVRKEQEEKELIMDRILDEERAQEEADEKVRAMKARLAAAKKKREEKKKGMVS